MAEELVGTKTYALGEDLLLLFLLNPHASKIPSKYLCLYPQTLAALNFGQVSIFLQWTEVSKRLFSPKNGWFIWTHHHQWWRNTVKEEMGRFYNQRVEWNTMKCHFLGQTAAVIMNPPWLWLPAQDLHKFKPAQTHHGGDIIRADNPQAPPLLRSYRLAMDSFWERESFFIGDVATDVSHAPAGGSDPCTYRYL